MLPESLIKNSRRGAYKPVPEEFDFTDGDASARSDVKNVNARPSFLWLYLTLSAFGGFIAAVAMVNLFPGDFVRSTEGGGNIKLQKLLQLPKESVVFSPVRMFEDAPTSDSDAAWEAFLGPSLGLISLNDSKSYDLPPGSDGHVYQISMAHQIQCLYLIRKVYWGESRGIYNVSAHPQSAYVTHTNHCFDYLLQSIRCAADLSLESKTDASGNFIGWDVAHTCSSWEAVMSFMTKYKFDEAEKAIDHHHDHDDE